MALEILRSLIRLATPEEAVARAVHDATSFIPWRAAGETSAGRMPQPFQADLVYEAAGTVYEHGFAFVEAPTGAGKTDIGKHLATVLPVSHRHTVFSWGERADQQRLGSLALIPASVLKNWTTNAPANFKPIKHSHLSRRGNEEAVEMEEVNRAIRSSTSMIVDESHRLSSRYLAPSARSLVFECPGKRTGNSNLVSMSKCMMAMWHEPGLCEEGRRCHGRMISGGHSNAKTTYQLRHPPITIHAVCKMFERRVIGPHAVQCDRPLWAEYVDNFARGAEWTSATAAG